MQNAPASRIHAGTVAGGSGGGGGSSRSRTLHGWAQNGATTNYGITRKTSNLLKYLQGFKRTGLSFKRIELNCC